MASRSKQVGGVPRAWPLGGVPEPGGLGVPLGEVACARRPPRGGPAAELTPPCQAQRAAPPAVMTKASASIPVGASPRRGASAGRLAAGSPANAGDFLTQEGIPAATLSGDGAEGADERPGVRGARGAQGPNIMNKSAPSGA